MRLTLFLPHLAITGGLGIHCRGLTDALIQTASQGDRITILTLAHPNEFFPNSGLDNSWKQFTQDPRTTVIPIDWPKEHPLAQPLDPVLQTYVTASNSDVFYASYYNGLSAPPCPQVVTFHDAGFLDFPHIFGETARQRRETLAQVAPRIDRLHCISNDARQRICRLLPFPEERTAVVGHALFDSPQELAQAHKDEQNDLPLWDKGDRIADWGEYFFSPVGAATGFNRVRKNLPIAIESFRLFQKQSGKRGSNIRFIVASTGILHDAMLNELLPPSEHDRGSIVDQAWRSHDDRIRILPNLDRSPFLHAMAHASVIVYPSRYEGFGLPAIEAMSLGVPLLASRATSLPEVVGDAGYLVDPDRRDEFAHAMDELLTNHELRAKLIENGNRRVLKFSLDQMGQSMWELFRSIRRD